MRQNNIWTPVILILAIFAVASGPSWANWNTNPGNPGTSGSILALYPFTGPSGTFLYAGGNFDTGGGQTVNNIGRWNGSAWSAVGSGFNGPVRALIEFDDGSGSALYAGGDFTLAGTVSVNRVARWNGTAWIAVGQGMDNSVLDFEVFDDGTGPALYAAGLFTTADGATVNHLARWTGTNWVDVGGGIDGPVEALAVFDDRTGEGLYAGGLFVTAGGTLTANNIARWNGTAWTSLGAGTNGPVLAMEAFDDGNGTSLFVAGAFTQVGGGINAISIARWDGFIWIPLSDGTANGPVQTLSVVDELSGPALYAGGDFTSIGGYNVNRVAKWVGAEWTALQNGTNNTVLSLSPFDGPFGPSIFVGGSFTDAGGSTENIAIWDPGFISLPTKIRSVGYHDVDRSGTVNFNDLLILTFNNKIRSAQGIVGPTFFVLPVIGDSLGSNAIMNISPFDPRQVHIHLGFGVQLKVQGPWLPTQNSPGSPSGIDIHINLPPGTIQDEFGLDVEDNGLVNVNDGVRDIQFDIQEQMTALQSGIGGTLRPGQYTNFNKHRLVVPPGVLQSNQTISIRGGNLDNASAVTISPATAFQGVVTGYFEYKPLSIDRLGGDLEQGMRVRGWDPVNMVWRPLQSAQTIDTKRKVIMAPIFFDNTGGNKPQILSASSFTTFGNVGIPTIRAASGTGDPEKPGSYIAANLTITCGTNAVYTKHKIVLTGYTSGAAITVTLKQATLLEKANTGYTKNAIARIITTAETNNSDLLTLEYKDDNDPIYPSDVPGGNIESEMQIFYWDTGSTSWIQLPGSQTVDTINNLVTAPVANLANAEFYSVQPGLVTTTGVGPDSRNYR